MTCLIALGAYVVIGLVLIAWGILHAPDEEWPGQYG